MKKFDLTSTAEDVGGISTQIVAVQGYLDSSTFPQMQEHLESLVDEDITNIIVDLRELNYISSAGIGVLMGMLQEIRNRDGDLKLASMSAKIRNLFDMLGFSRLIRIYDDVPSAQQSFVNDSLTASDSKDDTPAEDSY